MGEVRNLGAEMSRFASKCKDEKADSIGISRKLSGLKILCSSRACGFKSRPGYKINPVILWITGFIRLWVTKWLGKK